MMLRTSKRLPVSWKVLLLSVWVALLSLPAPPRDMLLPVTFALEDRVTADEGGQFEHTCEVSVDLDAVAMDNGPSQDSRAVAYPYRNTYAQRVQPNNSSLNNTALKFESDSPILDETIQIVNDKVWSFRSALKAAAEALVSFGLPPQVVGYESVPVGDDEKLAEKNDGEAALQKVAEDEMFGRSSSRKSKEDGWQHRTGEGSRLVPRPDDGDDTNHAFAEAVRKEKEERKSLTRTYDFDEIDEEDGRRN